MKKSWIGIPVFLIFLTGCGSVGDKAASLTSIYATTAILALLILVAYSVSSKKKNAWFLVLLASVLVVNTGYLALAISNNLETALMANRLSYLGSVFLPLSMLMIILNITRIRYRKWLPILLLSLSVVIFLIAASPGYSGIYYKEVFFQKVAGVTVLKKVYGPLHGIYLVYLLGYFGAMVTTIIHATLHDKVDSTFHAVILAVAVFVNIGVWLIEQLVKIDFEILSVSYIISELFLMGLHLLMKEMETQKEQLLLQIQQNMAQQAIIEGAEHLPGAIPQEQLELFADGICRLTPKERELYECYVAGMSTAEIQEHLSIKENTLKFHNKNLYSKLGINSRKQLIHLHKILSSDFSDL